jgi:GntR family transcriptional regulator
VGRVPQIRIDLAASEPAYRQIARQLRTLMVDREMTPGHELPGVRRLAMDLSVHFNTVAEAYRLLAEEGWIDVSHGKTARVLDRAQPSADRAESERQFERLRHLVAEIKARGVPESRLRRELLSLLEGMKS